MKYGQYKAKESTFKQTKNFTVNKREKEYSKTFFFVSLFNIKRV